MVIFNIRTLLAQRGTVKYMLTLKRFLVLNAILSYLLKSETLDMVKTDVFCLVAIKLPVKKGRVQPCTVTDCMPYMKGVATVIFGYNIGQL